MTNYLKVPEKTPIADATLHIASNYVINEAPVPKTVQFMTIAFLKSREEANHGRLEFVKFDEKVFEKIEEEIQESLKNYIVTFIRTPIIHSKHRAQPIVGVDPGEFCILAEDALFHFLRKLIFGGKVFQREMNQEIKWMINQLENLFYCDFLKAFLHDQRACARVWALKCATCKPETELKKSTKSENPKKFKDTKWRFYKRNEIQLARNFDPNDNDAFITLSDGVKLYSSLNLYYNLIQKYNQLKGIPRMTENKFDEISRNSKLFLLDAYDASYASSSIFKLNEQVKKSIYSSDKPFLHNLGAFSKVYKKHFYIRTVAVTPIQIESRRRVFAEEILEILEIILDGKEKEKLKKNQNSWKLNSGKSTLSLEELKQVLEDLDVDKSRISLILDLSETLSTIQMMRKTGDPVISLNFEKAEIVMSNYQAIFKIFQSIICEIDWSTDSCKKHPKCAISHKSKILEHIKKYQSMTEGAFVPAEDVDDLVKDLKAHCNYSNRKGSHVAPMVKLFDANFNEFVSMHFFLEELKKCGISTDSESEDVAGDSEKLKASGIPVWKTRILFMLAWIEAFFGNEFKKLKEILRRAMMYRIPCPEFEKDEDLMNILLGTDEEKEEQIAQLSMITLNDNPPSHESLKTAKPRSWTFSGHGYRWNDPISLGIVQKFLEGIQKTDKATPESKRVNEQTATVVQKNPELATVTPKTRESAPDETREDSDSRKSNEQSSTAPQKTSEIQKTFEDLKITKGTLESAPGDVKTLEYSKKAPEASPPLQKIPEPTVPQKESKNCEKCFRTCEMLNEAKKELKSNENRIKNLEKKVSTKEKKLEEFEDQKQKIQEKEKEIQEKSEEIEQLKRKVEESLKIAEDNGKLISEVTKLTDSIAELKEEHSKQTEKFLESQNQQFDQISHLEYELDMARQTTEILNQKILELENQRAENENWEAEKQNLHLEIQENRGKIKEFYDENIRMRTENEVNQRMIQQLLDKLSSARSSGNSYSNPPVATSGRDYSNPGQGPYDDPPYMSNDRTPESSSTYSTSLDDAPNASSYSNHHETPPASNYNNPEISKCQICRYELKSDDLIYKCYQCRCPSHTNCASN
ncbi:Protein CBG04303 [Caenorhabditis briggsae]|uniref:Protein CBG04303 n=1 Tax=Caenorhabditis briggsae TaxID=6238 RepID=A8WX70_CAEBR|nr:Protein CBG04303 [Caenorhabditis briggsae]CAP25038.2 Protein CBG04303 [Caenorhabditis briggsae]